MSVVVARCRRCKGWTMFHADVNSDTGKEWTAHCRRKGDIIIVGEPASASLGVPCKEDDFGGKCEAASP